MLNLDHGVNQNEEHIATNKFKNHLFAIRAEHEKSIQPNLHPTYNERYQKIIELLVWTLERYRANIRKKNHQNEAIIIDSIIEELDKKEK